MTIQFIVMTDTPSVRSRPASSGQSSVIGRSALTRINTSGYSAASVIAAIFHRRGGSGGA